GLSSVEPNESRFGGIETVSGEKSWWVWLKYVYSCQCFGHEYTETIATEINRFCQTGSRLAQLTTGPNTSGPI
ncbi:MAG: hypothetical protein AAFW82_00055, partial [Pseudomonadota bacterium]